MPANSLAMTRNPLDGAFPRQSGPRVLRTPSPFVTEIGSDDPDTLVSGTVPKDDAYVVTLHLRERPRGGISAEGRWFDPKNFAAGNAGIVDLRMSLSSEYAGPFHYLSFYLTRAMLDSVADDAGAPCITELRHRPGVGFSDPVIRHLLLSLSPAVIGPMDANALYADHVATAFVTHIATAYGEMHVRERLLRGGLTPAQERRAKELLAARLDGGVSLAELAALCGVSVRHFARAFRQSTGTSPHRWLVERRLEKAKAMLDESRASLAQIADACGFANQSHFTRAFTRDVGTSPGAWRRERRS